MPLDGVSLNFLIKELQDGLAGARVDKITQPQRNAIVISLRGAGENHQLLLSANPANPRLHLSRQTFTNPPQAPMFCMLLRKHLGGARLMSVEGIGLERIVILRFLSTDEFGDRSEKRLICEIMGRHSNIILVNENQTIIDSVLHVDQGMSRIREVMPARPYTYPPAQNKLLPTDILQKITFNTWTAYLDTIAAAEKKSPTTSNLLLQQVAGFSPFLCTEVCALADIEETRPWLTLNEREKGQINDALAGLLSRITAELANPSLYYPDESSHCPHDFHALALQHQGICRPADNISVAMEQYFGSREAENRIRQKQQNLSKLLTKQMQHADRKRSIYLKDIRSSENYEDLKLKGDLILANLWQIKEGMKTAVVQNYYADPVEDMSIELNPDRSPTWNAQNYYRRYNKNKTKNSMSRQFLQEIEDTLTYLNSLQNFVDQADSLEELSAVKSEMSEAGITVSKQKQKNLDNTFKGRKARRKRGLPSEQAALGPRRYCSSEGFVILAGRNNLQNDKLTLRQARKDDLWFHVQKAPGTHIIVRSEGKTVPQQTILEAAQTAAWFSKGNSQVETVSGGQIPVDFCPVANVKKPAGAKPGMVIYTDYQTLMVTARDPEYLLQQEEGHAES